MIAAGVLVDEPIAPRTLAFAAAVALAVAIGRRAAVRRFVMR